MFLYYNYDGSLKIKITGVYVIVGERGPERYLASYVGSTPIPVTKYEVRFLMKAWCYWICG